MSTAAEIQQMKKKRFQFLHRCYELSEGSSLKFFNMYDIGEELGFDHDLTGVVTEYLVGEELIEYQTFGGGISITHWGIRQIEEAISKVDRPTRYFPAVINIVAADHITGTQIQQSSPAARQIVFGEAKEQELAGLIESLKDSIGELGLNDQEKSDLQAEILTLEAQASKSKPNRAIISATLKSAWRILERGAGGALAVGFIELIKALLAG